MEIQQQEKELTKTEDQIPPSISKDLKEIKTIFVNLYKKEDIINVDLHSQFIETRFREVSKKLSINERKVLRAYLDFQLQDATKKLDIVQDRTNRRQKSNFSLFPALKNGRISPNQNRLLQAFKSWFMSNLRLAKGLGRKKQMFLKQISEAQKLLNSLLEGMIETKQRKNNQNKPKYCETTLILILIVQFNLCVFLLYRNNYTSAKSVISKFKQAVDVLKRQNNQKQTQILRNLTLIQELHKEHDMQLKQYFSKNPKKSFRTINSLRSCPDDELRQEKESLEEEKINHKFTKVIDEVIEKNREIMCEQERVNYFLENISERMLRVQNALLFETEHDFIVSKNHKLEALPIKLFQNQKLNSAVSIMLNQRDQQPSQRTPPSISQLLFVPTQSQDMFLSIAKIRTKNLELSIKDYFNLCMFLKKSQINKEAIIYFEILVFHFRKKNLVWKFCLRTDFMVEIEDDDDIGEEEKMGLREKAAAKELQQFMRNQELLKIMLFALVNLIQLYELQNAHYWVVQTLNYLLQVIQFKVINVLEKICSKLKVSLNINTEDQGSHSSEHETQDLKQCRKLIKKYTNYLEEIKFKIIKSSFNSLTSQIINHGSMQIKGSIKKINISAQEKTAKMRTLRKTVQTPASYNMKRLQEKENQLHTLIHSPKGSFGNLDRMYRTGVQTPRNLMQLNKTCDFIDSTEICNISKERQLKGASYQIKKKTRKTPRTSYKDTIKKDNPPVLLLKKKPSINQGAKPCLKPSLKQKHQVKFHLSTTLDAPMPSCSQVKTYKSIGQQSNKNTVAFLDTVKTLDQSTKNTRMGEHRKQILQSKEGLQDHIKLCFMKINSCIKGLCYSTESLNQAKAQTFDFTSQMDEVLHEFDQLLLGLKMLRSHSDESYQRELLIEAKVKLLEMVKEKSVHDKVIEICMVLLNDINLMKNSEKRIQLKKKILWELSQNYMGLKQIKKAISAYLQLARLGDSIGYLKIGEIYMNMKEYHNSIKFHQKYAAQRNYDLSSKVRLTHAYSKVPQYYMKTIDMLSGLLIAPGSSSKFKQEIYERRHDDRLIESAVILLSSLHFKNQNVQKAIQLCESYCKVNIKNHRVLHILGSYYKFKGSTKKAFWCYLNALENNPTHHKSLIQLTEFICEGGEYKSHAIQLLRKCFCMESRNFQLVRTLVRFLVEGEGNKQEQEKEELDYLTLIKYAEILTNSHTRGYSGQNFYEEALLVYEWALSLLDKSVSIANLDEVEQVYKNLGEICLKRGDYARSESYYKLFLVEIEKYVSRSNISESMRQEKIGKIEMQIFHFMGKVKKNQQSYKKAISYFNKSHELQVQYQQKLPNLQSYFHFFELGQCFFMLENYEVALRKFTEHKDHLLYFINNFDGEFFREERREDFTVEPYMEMKEKREPEKKVNFLKQWINGQNQSSQTQVPEESDDVFEVEYILKKNYFETELYTAFCNDTMRQFMDSKEIYKKVLGFFEEAEETAKIRQRMRSSGKKQQPKEELQRIRLNYIKHITGNYTGLNNDFKVFKKVAMINLANIYRIEGLEGKFADLIQQCEEEFPENFVRNEVGYLMINKLEKLQKNSDFMLELSDESSSDHDENEDGKKKVFKTSLDNLDRLKERKIHFADLKMDKERRLLLV